MQLFREGWPAYSEAGRSCLQRFAMIGCVSLFGPSLGALHAPALMAFGLECLLLALLARRLAGSRAAAWAVLVNCLCAFSMLRSRSLMAHSLSPLEFLFFLWILPRARGPLAAFAWCFSAACLILDYEIWALGLLLLLLCFWNEKGEGRWAGALGLFCGLALLAWLSRAGFSDYLSVRLAVSRPGPGEPAWLSLLQGLRSFFWEGFKLPFLGMGRHAAFPPWALGFLALGLLPAWRRWKLGVLIALAGFLPLLSRASSEEPQRAILAWPLLCLFSGMGAAWSMERLKPSQAMALGALLLALGVAWEVRAGRQARAEFEARSSGEWKLWIEVAKEARAHSGGPELECTELGGQDGAALRFLLDAQGPARGSSAVALVGADYAFAASKLGTLKVFDSGDGAQPCALLYPHPQGAARLREVDSLLQPLFSRLGPLGPLRRRQEALAWLDAHPRADPWARNAAWELVLFNSVILHDIPRQRMLQALSEPLLSARIPMELAEKLSDAAPREAGALRRLAGRIDPTRLKARADQVR